MATYHTVRLTAAAVINLPVGGLTLRRVRCFGGATPGTFQWTLDANGANAHFASPSNGTRGYATYDVQHHVPGLTLPAALFAFNGGLSSVELVFGMSAAGGGQPLSAWRAIRYARTDAGTTTATISGTFPGSPAKPKAILGYISASAGRATFPVQDNLTFAHEALVTDRVAESMPVPDIQPTNTLDLSVATDAAATVQFLVYY